jgi:DNA-directed RNA polymerase specialized sigma subunit
MTTREIPRDVAEDARRARELSADVKAKLDEVSRLNRGVVNQLIESGWKQSEIAEVLGVSFQRVFQLVKDLKRATPKA